MPNLIGVGGDGLVDQFLDDGAVGQLPQPLSLDDGVDLAAVPPHGLERLPGGVSGEGVVGDAIQQRGQLLAADFARGDVQPIAMQQRRQFAHDPVGREFRRGAGVRRGAFKIIGRVLVGGEHVAVALRQPELAHKPLPPPLRQFRQRTFDALDPRLLEDHRQQIRIGKVTIILGVFLAAHGAGLFPFGIIQARLLHDLLAVFLAFHLPPDLIVQRLLDETERVEVLDLRARSQFARAGLAHRHIGVAPQGAFLHVAVADAEVTDQTMDGFHAGRGLGGGAQDRLRDDLQQGNTGAIQIDAGVVAEVLMLGFAGVLL